MRTNPLGKDEKHRPGSFATTRWSLVAAAGRRGGAEAGAALENLCRAYWYPLYCYVRRRGYAPADAEDLVQGFFARVLDKELFAQADETRGKLRAFLLTSLQFHLADERKREGAAKRGGGVSFVPLDTADAESRYSAEPVDAAPADEVFDTLWAATLLERARSVLAEAWQAAGKAELFAALSPYVTATLDATGAARIAAQFGMTENHVKVSVHRLRERYGATLRQEVAETVTGEEEIEQEMAALRSALV